AARGGRRGRGEHAAPRRARRGRAPRRLPPRAAAALALHRQRRDDRRGRRAPAGARGGPRPRGGLLLPGAARRRALGGGVSAGEVRALLARHGLAARRSLGQNFLVDPRRAERLVTLAGVEPGDAVLEIGTGLGILTRALALRGAHVTTVEVDAGLLAALRDEPLLPPDVRLLAGDALDLDLEELLREVRPPRRVVANLPYSVAAPILRRLLDLAPLLEDWSVMLQRDVAARLLAAPGTRDYGSLTVLHRLVVETRRCDELAPGCFHPAPKVRSTFVRMRPLRPPPLARGELAQVENV